MSFQVFGGISEMITICLQLYLLASGFPQQYITDVLLVWRTFSSIPTRTETFFLH